jgi:hypothetical protein
MAAPNANPNSCNGVKTVCCSNKINESLAVTVVNNCGTFTGRMYYDSSANSGSGGWKGTVPIKCKPNPMASCNSTFTNVTLEMYCNASGWWVTSKCSGTTSAAAGMTGTCSPFSQSQSFALPGDCSCSGNITVTVTE